MTKLSKLFAYISTLHQARIALQVAKVAEDIAKERLSHIPEWLTYQRMVEERKCAAKVVEAQEADVRQLAVDMFKETGATRFPGVSITKTTEMVFTNAEAIEYCIKRGLVNFLLLDQKTFDKWALANAADEKIRAQFELEWITTMEVPAARIDSNLDKAKEEIVTEPELLEQKGNQP